MQKSSHDFKTKQSFHLIPLTEKKSISVYPVGSAVGTLNASPRGLFRGKCLSFSNPMQVYLHCCRIASLGWWKSAANFAARGKHKNSCFTSPEPLYAPDAPMSPCTFNMKVWKYNNHGFRTCVYSHGHAMPIFPMKINNASRKSKLPKFLSDMAATLARGRGQGQGQGAGAHRMAFCATWFHGRTLEAGCRQRVH